MMGLAARICMRNIQINDTEGRIGKVMKVPNLSGMMGKLIGKEMINL